MSNPELEHIEGSTKGSSVTLRFDSVTFNSIGLIILTCTNIQFNNSTNIR